ncbi:MAG: pyruvate, phosphate dikinase [Waddliaceae bacterium]|jgi:pyruvate, orthophosphate dikinase|nr:pyruvate, phosphate dikinase [Waddliaceae bacterium]MBT3578889.1 pyruvate, phosphate dikinase [Waddliaceae bacterium]MBT4445035.1 pyruvate, phosphate dikinase [Waddliaceae bacterium]MBT6929043.1 pyruvate, phosphate dikinase [Waddliaceae bacterium]MBT7264042.1 pyruvate, phosphate dikinase [Waddliaceae bacterium]
MTEKYVYSFGVGEEIAPLDKDLLGGKGKNLVEMTSLGLPVPPGLVITTETCRSYMKNKGESPEGMEEQTKEALALVEKKMGATFGSEDNPLLVSVRSGAPISMPGMMDTVLNLGLNDISVVGFAKVTDNEKLAYDNYRRFIMMYGDVVRKVHKNNFEEKFEEIKKEEGVDTDSDVSVEGFKKAVAAFKEVYKEHIGEDFPQDPWEQLFTAVEAVFRSWNGHRAIVYRQVNNIPDNMGTAVNIQTMVFGNKGPNSATGVGFTRDPATGDKHFYGEYLINAQGEEVVAGTRTPHPINLNQKKIMGSDLSCLEDEMPEMYKELDEIVEKLEEHYKDMQDIEFTIDDGRLFMLQTRIGKRTGFAAIRMAVEMLEEGLIDEKTALLRVDPNQLVQLLAPIFDDKEKIQAHDDMVAKGLNAGPGAASGEIVLSWEKAIEVEKAGRICILVRDETCPDDFPGMVAAVGILTARGGSTSHAAVVARGMGKPCVAGCGALTINEEAGTVVAGKRVLKEGDQISIDGSTGEVFFCKLETHPSSVIQALVDGNEEAKKGAVYKEFTTIMESADKYRRLLVRTNADTPHDCDVARAFGAQGIGLCRTEHMFMEKERLNDVRRMFFSTSDEKRKEAIDNLLEYQKGDFIGIFRAMDGLPVTIRLLDPPLHEFMPHNDEEIKTVADVIGMSFEELKDMTKALQETNPMLGHRGCRLGVMYPSLTKMQARAIIEAAIEVKSEGKTVIPEIMVPLVCMKNEFVHQKALIDETAKEVFEEKGETIEYLVGTMIELPRAAIVAGRIAEGGAEFFSFGTNDLTQTTLGISRDDAGKFIPTYVSGVEDPRNKDALIRMFQEDPFQAIDQDGVGELMKIAVERGRNAVDGLKCGICGEHGGEPSSVIFCDALGLDYVSCSPYRIPVARLAAAHAVLLKDQ